MYSTQDPKVFAVEIMQRNCEILSVISKYKATRHFKLKGNNYYVGRLCSGV